MKLLDDSLNVDSQVWDRLRNLEDRVIELFPKGDPSHDLLHLKRVLKTALFLATTEGGNLEILIPAVLLHDIVQVPKNSPERSSTSEMAALKASEILEPLGWSKDDIKKIAQAVLEHSYSRGLAATSVESAILQDSDRLDALGAIGLMRMVSCGTLMGTPFYEDSIDVFSKNTYEDRKYIIDHVFTKLIRLPELMNFQWSQAEARKRFEFMEHFLRQLGAETQQSPINSEKDATRYLS